MHNHALQHLKDTPFSINTPKLLNYKINWPFKMLPTKGIESLIKKY